MGNDTSVEADLRARSDGLRLLQLDSLRGLAALSVVLYHTRLATNDSAPHWTIAWLYSGNQAVCLFFVLSGFVLCGPFLKGTQGSYANYLLRRIVRVYLPYLIALFFALLGALIFEHSQVRESEWFRLTWHSPITPLLVMAHLAMVPSAALNTAFWSLNFEMVASALMPAIVFAMKIVRPSFLLPLLLAAAFVPTRLFDPRNSHQWPGITVQVLAMFALGVWLAQNRERCTGLLRGRRWAQWLLLICSLLIYFGYPLFVSPRLRSWIPTHRAWAVYAVGAAGVILCSLESPEVSCALKSSLPEYLGEISYSLYLTHSVVLFSLFDLLYGRIPALAIKALVIVCSLLAATAFYVLFERPCIRVTRQIRSKSVQKHSSGSLKGPDRHSVSVDSP